MLPERAREDNMRAETWVRVHQGDSSVVDTGCVVSPEVANAIGRL